MTSRVDAELAHFCERHHPRLLRMLTAYVGDAGTAEELVQDALVRLCRDWRQVQRMDRPDAWLTTVAFNLARSWFRRSYAGRRARRRLEARQVEPGLPDKEAGMVVMQALERLPARQRQAVILRFLDDVSVADAARVMGCAQGTVKAHTSRGLEALRRMDLDVDLPPPDDPESDQPASPSIVRASAERDTRGV